MAKEKIRVPGFDEIVFENRNKEYGAYRLRKKYSRNVMIGMIAGIIVVGTAIITPYLKASAEVKAKRAERQVLIKLENLDVPQEKVEPPPPPPPPPQETVQQIKYVAPVVVDTLKPEDMKQLMTTDQAQATVTNEDVNKVEAVPEEVKTEEAPQEVFIVVEEMPSFPGGEKALYDYIYANIKYPDIAKENNIQGRVFMKFCVTYKGSVDQVQVVKGVDPSLDAEAIRIIKILPTFKPGKQGGKPVNVWFQIMVTFQLK